MFGKYMLAKIQQNSIKLLNLSVRAPKFGHKLMKCIKDIPLYPQNELSALCVHTLKHKLS